MEESNEADVGDGADGTEAADWCGSSVETDVAIEEADETAAAAANPAVATAVVACASWSSGEADVATVGCADVVRVAASAVNQSTCCRSSCYHSLNTGVVCAVPVHAIRVVPVGFIVTAARDAFRRQL